MEHPPGYINRRVCESVCVYYTEIDYKACHTADMHNI